MTAADVFEFLAHRRADRTVVRLADRESVTDAGEQGRWERAFAGATAPMACCSGPGCWPARAARFWRAAAMAPPWLA